MHDASFFKNAHAQVGTTLAKAAAAWIVQDNVSDGLPLHVARVNQKGHETVLSSVGGQSLQQLSRLFTWACT